MNILRSLNDRSPSSGRFRCLGFTFVELLVVMVVIAILASVLLPAITQSREAGRRATCLNNAMQIGVALHNYMMLHEVLPPGTQNVTGPIRSRENAGYHMGWLMQILPYLDRTSLYDEIDFTRSVYDRANRPVRQTRIDVLSCPSDDQKPPTIYPVTNYCGVHHDVEAPIDVGQNGVLFLNSAISYEQIEDGTSNTIFVVESAADERSRLGWAAGTRSSLRNSQGGRSKRQGTAASGSGSGPYDSRRPNGIANNQREGLEVETVGGPGSNHSGNLFIALMGDGSVRTVSFGVDPDILRMAAHRADNDMNDDL